MKKIVALAIIALFTVCAAGAWAAEKATPGEVYEKVLQAATVLQNLGDEALPAFNDPKGEFVWKDSYVYIIKCPATMIAHPFALDKLKGMDLRKFHFQDDLCAAAADPKGKWVEYMWPKPGQKEPSRKITFIIQVPGTPYQAAAGIYNDDISLEELNGKR